MFLKTDETVLGALRISGTLLTRSLTCIHRTPLRTDPRVARTVVLIGRLLTNAKLNVKFTFEGKYQNNLTIEYSEEQGYHTESRYNPTITCNELEGTMTAKRILLKNLGFEHQEFDEFIWHPDERHDNDWFKIRDMIEEING